jgi:hypothetical protein
MNEIRTRPKLTSPGGHRPQSRATQARSIARSLARPTREASPAVSRDLRTKHRPQARATYARSTARSLARRTREAPPAVSRDPSTKPRRRRAPPLHPATLRRRHDPAPDTTPVAGPHEVGLRSDPEGRTRGGETGEARRGAVRAPLHERNTHPPETPFTPWAPPAVSRDVRTKPRRSLASSLHPATLRRRHDPAHDTTPVAGPHSVGLSSRPKERDRGGETGEARRGGRQGPLT